MVKIEKWLNKLDDGEIYPAKHDPAPQGETSRYKVSDISQILYTCLRSIVLNLSNRFDRMGI